MCINKIIRTSALLAFLLTFISSIDAKKPDSHVEMVEIYYSHHYGYGIVKSKAVYCRDGDFFVFQLDNWRLSCNSPDVFIAIREYDIDEFVDGMLNMQRDTCDAYSISRSDLELYPELVETWISRQYDSDSFKHIDKSKYLSIPDEKILSLSCQETSVALSSHCDLFYYNGMPYFKVIFTYSDGTKATLRPFQWYEGVPWLLISQDKSFFIDYDYVYNFLNKIGYGRFLSLRSRGKMVAHIVHYLLNGGMRK